MKKFELSIPKPCHENWGAMTPQDKGRFCGSCQKTVIDFSGMSDAQIAQFFKKPSGAVCGRFDETQLNRAVEMPRKRLPWIKHFFTIALPAVLFSKKTAAQNYSQRSPLLVGKIAVRTTPKSADTAKPLSLKPLLTVSGTVQDENGSPVPYATVAAREVGRIVAADSTGSFSIAVSLLPLKLEISSIGYETHTVLYNGEKNFTVHLRAAERSMVTLGVVVRTVTKKKTASKVVQPKTESLPKTETQTAFSVYPNPVSPNSSFTLDAKELQDGIYTLQLFNIPGDLVQTKELAIERKGKQNIALGDVAAGTYVIRLTAKKGNKAYSEVILVR